MGGSLQGAGERETGIRAREGAGEPQRIMLGLKTRKSPAFAAQRLSVTQAPSGRQLHSLSGQVRGCGLSAR